MSELQEQPQIDVNRIGCKIVDVHSCLQRAFEEFAERGDNTLEGLAKKIQESLSEMPVFLMGELQQ
jgi:hypothetical protein